MLATSALLFLCSAHSSAQHVDNSEYEYLGEIPFDNEFSFVAFGRHFDVKLERNDAIVRNIPTESRQHIKGIELYRGEITGIPGSWVRLTRHDKILSAFIWDGLNYYKIRTAADSESPADEYQGSGHAYSIHRLNTPRDIAIDSIVHPPVESGIATRINETPDEPYTVAYQQEGATAAAVLQTPVSPGKQIGIGLVADFELYEIQGGARTATVLLDIANAVDGFLVRQLGVHLNVTFLELMTSDDQAFTGTSAATLLNEAATYKNSTAERRALGLLHLFTGKNLLDLNNTGVDSRVLGLANIGSVCDAQFGVALTQARNSSDAVFIAAHEIGHNFGAPHDGEPGSVCAAEPATFIMAPNLSFSSQFSTCSIGQMLPALNGGACLSILPANDLAILPILEPDGPIPNGGTFDGEFVIENLGLTTAYGVQVSAFPQGAELVYGGISGSGQGDCLRDMVTTAIDCYNHDLEAGSQIAFKFRAAGTVDGPATIRAEILSQNDENRANDTYLFEFDVVPSVDFAFTGSTQSNRIIHPEGEISEVLLRVLNRGVVTATNAVAEISASPPYEIVEVLTPARTPCPVSQLAAGTWECQLGSIEVDQPLEIPVSIRGVLEEDVLPGDSVTGSINLKLVADQPEKDFNEWSHAPVVIAPSFADLIPELIPPSAINGEDEFTVSIIGRNLGPDSVSDAILSISSNFRLDISSIDSDNASCEFNDRTRDYDCTVSELQAGSAINVTLTARLTVDEFASVSAFMSALTYDSRGANNRQNLMLRETEVTPDPAPDPDPPAAPPAATASSGGGGGSTGLTWIILLSLLTLGRSYNCYCPILGKTWQHKLTQADTF